MTKAINLMQRVLDKVTVVDGDAQGRSQQTAILIACVAQSLIPPTQHQSLWASSKRH